MLLSRTDNPAVIEVLLAVGAQIMVDICCPYDIVCSHRRYLYKIMIKT